MSSLARLYANMNKTASEEALTTDDISATQFLEAVASGDLDLGDYLQVEEGEKTASEGDLTWDDLTNEELQAIADGDFSMFEGGVEKNAAAQDAAYLQEAGAMMARAFHSEMNKLASEDSDLPDVIDLDEITASDAQALIESGEYEYVDGDDFGDMDKEAMSRAAKMKLLRRLAPHMYRGGAGAAKGAFRAHQATGRGGKALAAFLQEKGMGGAAARVRQATKGTRKLIRRGAARGGRAAVKGSMSAARYALK